jgi:Tetratricopeptide repeat
VLGPLLEDPLAAGDAIGALRRYSLITPAADGSVSVHRLVQAVTADQMPAELARDWQQAAAELIEATIPGDPDMPRTWPACARLLPHAQVALADDSAGMDRIADYLGSSGSYATARDLQRRVLNARERVLGPKHPHTLADRGHLAHWTGQAGDPAAARDLLAQLLPVRERVLGPEHPDTLAARANLARWTGEAGDAAGARDQFAALLPVAERVLCPEHPITLRVRNNLAHWTRMAGGGPGSGMK